MADLADVRIKHPSGLLLPAHTHILAQQSRVLKELFRSLRTPVGGKRKAAEEEAVLETPFNQHSVQEVAYLLCFLYRPQDCKPAHLAAAEEHLPGVVQLAHALDAPELLAAISEGLASSVQELEGALRWLLLAEECQLDAARDEGVRTLAASVLAATPGGPNTPAGPAAVAVRFQRLAQLRQTTLAAALTVVAMTANAASPACREELATRVPGVPLLAALRSPGLQQASFSWDRPRLPAGAGAAAAAVGAAEDRVPCFWQRRWQLVVLPQGDITEEAIGSHVAAFLAVCLPEGSRTILPCVFSVELLGESGQPIIWSTDINFPFHADKLKVGARFAKVDDLRANSQLYLPGGDATFRARVAWLECKAEEPAG